MDWLLITLDRSECSSTHPTQIRYHTLSYRSNVQLSHTHNFPLITGTKIKVKLLLTTRSLSPLFSFLPLWNTNLTSLLWFIRVFLLSLLHCDDMYSTKRDVPRQPLITGRNNNLIIISKQIILELVTGMLAAALGIMKRKEKLGSCPFAFSISPCLNDWKITTHAQSSMAT